jgi:general secretion pathway protein G
MKADGGDDRGVLPGTVDGAVRPATSGTGCRPRGLTLIELLIVIAIIGVLSGIAIPLYFNQIQKARNIKTAAELDNLQFEIKNFELDYGRLPESLEEVKPNLTTDPWGNAYQYVNFTTLEDDPEEEDSADAGKKQKGKAKGKGKGKDGDIADEAAAEAEISIRLDQFGDPLNSDYDLYSCGKDGKSAPSIDDPLSRDDVVRGRDGAFIGRASQFEP